MWQTTCTAVRGGDEGFVIDSPVYPEELRALPEVLEQAGFPVSGLLVTHGDWDHLLGAHGVPRRVARLRGVDGRAAGGPSSARPSASCATSTSSITSTGGRRWRSARSSPFRCRGAWSSARGRDRPHELELHPTAGHTADGVAYWLPWARTLVCGDYLSPVEIPALSPSGSVSAYRATLARLAPLVAQAEWVVPGHGAPIGAERAEQVRVADDAYLEQLETRSGHRRAAAGPEDRPPRAAPPGEPEFL